MVKRSLRISGVILIIGLIIVSLMISIKESLAADDDIASGTSGSCTWVIDSQGVLTISPTNGMNGTLASYIGSETNLTPWGSKYINRITKVVIEQGVKTNEGASKLFSNLSNCTDIDVTNLDTSNAVNMSNMFNGCTKVTTIDLSNFNTSNVTNMAYMFESCSNLNSLDVTGFNTSNVTNMAFMFENCTNLNSLDVSNFDTSKVQYISHMFAYCKNLTELDVSNFNTANVTDMTDLFFYCTGLSHLDVTGFNTEKVKDMDGLFYCCNHLESLDVSNFNTSNVEGMSNMFSCCEKLTTLDLSNFNTSKVIRFSSMFCGCSNIENIDISNFDTSNAKAIDRMFMACWKLRNIDVSSFNTNNVTSMYEMFSNCENLISLDLSSFNTSKVINMYDMFFSCKKMQTIQLGELFSFRGNNIENTTNQAILPSPSSISPYTGNWIREDKAFGPGTSNWLRDNYDGSTMAGKWIWEKVSYSSYSIEHYTEKVDGTFELKEIENKEGITDSEVTAIAKTYTGFSYDNGVQGTKASGSIASDGSLVLKLYYKRNVHNVFYSYVGDVPDGATELPEVHQYKYGEYVMVAGNASAPGYTFSGWNYNNFIMPNNDVRIIGKFLSNNSTSYKIEHYLESLNGTYTLDDTINLLGETDTIVQATEKTYTGFTFDDSIEGTRISGNVDGNGSLVLRLYYKRNTYKVSYSYIGEIPEGASELPEEQSYKYESSVKIAEKATAPGYVFSGWNYDDFDMPASDVEITGSFKINTDLLGNFDEKPKIEIKEKTGAKEGSGLNTNLYNPKTDDTVQRNLALGFLGLIVMLIVIRISKKYGRKIKKIQF